MQTETSQSVTDHVKAILRRIPRIEPIASEIEEELKRPTIEIVPPDDSEQLSLEPVR